MTDLPPWRIRFLGVAALQHFPDLAAEWDAEWAKLIRQPDETVGEVLRRGDRLAIEIFERHGILKRRETKDAASWP